MFYLFPMLHTQHLLTESECEKASYAYLMQLLIFMVGLPLPLINLAGSVLFWWLNRKQCEFVRWHATQALVSQILLYVLNAGMFVWTVNVLLGTVLLSQLYFSTLFTLIVFNVVDYIFTVVTAMQVRKGVHYKWWIYAQITDKICGRYEKDAS